MKIKKYKKIIINKVQAEYNYRKRRFRKILKKFDKFYIIIYNDDIT